MNLSQEELKQQWEQSQYLKERQFYKYLKAKGLKATLKEIKAFLIKQQSIQLTKQPNKQTIFSSIVANRPRHNYQMDLMIYDRYERNNYKYVLGVIDVYSRYVYAIPLTNREQTPSKTKMTLYNAIVKAFQVMGMPQNLNADNEFKSRQLVDFFNKNNINVYYSYTDEIINKNSLIERFWRTLSLRFQMLRLNGQTDWVKLLPKVIQNYNHTEHSTVKDTPHNIFNNNQPNKQTIVFLQSSQYQKGDKVRLKIYKKLFDKGDVLTYSREVYELIEKVKNRWRIKNIKTNNVLKKAVIQRDMSKVNDVVEPDIKAQEATKQEDTRKKAIGTAKRLQKELNNIKIDGKDNVRTDKRKRKPKKIFDL